MYRPILYILNTPFRLIVTFILILQKIKKIRVRGLQIQHNDLLVCYVQRPVPLTVILHISDCFVLYMSHPFRWNVKSCQQHFSVSFLSQNTWHFPSSFTSRLGNHLIFSQSNPFFATKRINIFTLNKGCLSWIIKILGFSRILN